jgi:hypothetical protein
MLLFTQLMQSYYSPSVELLRIIGNNSRATKECLTIIGERAFGRQYIGSSPKDQYFGAIARTGKVVLHIDFPWKNRGQELQVLVADNARVDLIEKALGRLCGTYLEFMRANNRLNNNPPSLDVPISANRSWFYRLLN